MSRERRTFLTGIVSMAAIAGAGAGFYVAYGWRGALAYAAVTGAVFGFLIWLAGPADLDQGEG
jgi:hypothetical protein